MDHFKIIFPFMVIASYYFQGYFKCPAKEKVKAKVAGAFFKTTPHMTHHIIASCQMLCDHNIAHSPNYTQGSILVDEKSSIVELMKIAQ